MARVMKIAEAVQNDDGSFDCVVEVNEDDGSEQYARTPFHFDSGFDLGAAKAEMRAAMVSYLVPLVAADPAPQPPVQELLGVVIATSEDVVAQA